MSEYLRILILEDNPVDAELVQFELQEAGLSFDARVVITKKDFVRELREFSPDLILSDYDLPQYNGALALAESKKRCPDTPFILVTGAVSEDRAIEILTQGAKDYVLKSRLQQRLAPAVERALAEAEEQKARKRAEAELIAAHKNLELQVAERTAELQKELEHSNQIEKSLLKYNERLELLTYTAGRLLASDEPQQLVEELCQKVMEFLDCQAFFNFLVNEDAGCLHLNSCAGIPPEIAQKIEWLGYGVAVCGCVARDGSRIVAENIPTTPDIRTELIKSFGIKAYACHPLMVQDRVIGTLSFGTRSRTTFSTDDLTLMKAVADQVAIAMSRVMMENALRESEERYRELVQSSPDAVIVHRNGQFLFANPAALTLYGVESINILKNKNVLDFIHPDERAVIATRMEQGMTGQRLGLQETRLVRLDGQVVPVESIGGTVLYDGKAAVQIVIRDITERKKAEKKIEEAKGLLDALMEYVPEGITIADGPDVVTRMSSRYGEETLLNGWNKSSNLTVEDWLSRVEHFLSDGITKATPEDLPLWKAVKKGQTVEGEELVLRRPTGELMTVLCNAGPIKDKDGQVTGGIVAWRDISKIKESREALRCALEESERNRAFLEAIFGAQVDAVIIYNSQSKVQRANPTFIEVYGFNPIGFDVNEIMQRVACRSLDDYPSELEKQSTPRALNGQTVSGLHFAVTRADGTEGVVEVSSAPIWLEQRVIGAVTVWHDITVQKKTEEMLLASEIFLKETQAVARLGGWKANPDSEYLMWTEGVYNLIEAPLDYKPSFTEGLKFFAPEYRNIIQERLQHTLSTNEPFVEECKVTTRFGKQFWVEVHGLTSMSEGDIACVLGTIQDITERKKVEDELALSNQILAGVLEHTHIMAVLLDSRFNFIWVNHAYAQTCGHAPSFFPGKNHFNLYPHEENQAIFQQVVNTGESYYAEAKPFEFPDQPERGVTYWDWSVIPVKEGDGKVKWLAFTLVEITKRIQAEKALKESEDRFRAVFEQLAVGVALVNTKTGRYVQINQKYCDFVGYTMPEMLQKSFMDITHDEDIQANVDANMQLIEGYQREFSIEKRYLHKDGSLIWGKLTISPLWKSGEKPETYLHIAIVEDITEHKQAETALRESEQLYRAIGESIDYGIWVCDSEGRNIYASDSFLKLVGLTQEQCSNLGWGNVLHPDDVGGTIAAWQECVRTGCNWDIEHRFRGVDGQWYSVLARGVPVRNAKGKVVCWAGINLDINKLKQVESELKDRTQQLEAANKELESFSYSISHDLKAPLRAIEGFSRMLKKKYGSDFNEEVIRILDVILTNTEMTGSLIDALLAFSRVQQNIVSLSEIDMDKLANNVWDEIHELHQERELKVKITKLLPGLGDKILIRQVLYNLLTNAVKFTKDRTPGIIELTSRSETNRIVYCLKDNGTGFDMAYYDKLFGVFQRLHSQEEYEGTGIGLAIVQRIIKRHGGQVWAEGKVDKGATFYFTLQRV